MGSKSPAKLGPSVSLDWRTPLSPEKNHAYLSTLHRLETGYSMLSVTLDEAIGMRRNGRVQMAHQVLAVAPALCDKLCESLLSLLRAMTLHARHFGTTPSLASLNPNNFLQARSQRAARFNSVLTHALLTRRSQFLYKISTLLELTEDLRGTFGASVQELAEGALLRTDQYWGALDASHYDLNTCLRESVVLFKCFLQALLLEQLPEFQATLQQEGQSADSKSHVASLTQNVAHRRLTPVKGQ